MKRSNLFAVIFTVSFVLLFSCKEIMDHPVNPDLPEVIPTPCEGISPSNLWLLKQISGWSKGAISILSNEEAGKLGIFVAMFSEEDSEKQYFGVKGEYTAQLKKTFKNLQGFWDINSDNILMVAAHGTMLQDRDKVINVYQAEYGYSLEKANKYADSLATLFKTYPEYLNGNHPFFTFNAYAHQQKNYPVVGQVKDKIVFGDALLQPFDALGYGDIAPQAILAHEYAHHIQYDLGIKDYSIPLTPAGNRRTELMADAYAAYFLSHSRGAAMEWKSVQRVAEVFSNLGDCDFESELHHGTPVQRKAATEWGYDLAKNAEKTDHIIGSREFAKLFDAELNNIVKK
ncbi:hypothetical protein [Dyadobacter sp. CY326]|uniref:hypothetical protein n=1 Tax=Dyadobacter sp. CY326 TaxID=2907300 RepID=UPI001F3128C8|nr:hypothetical protein [Dyadobacter sp. CY326]MCE7064031.1 hypothetical protein [Dyadobacter sp. CY326]